MRYVKTVEELLVELNDKKSKCDKEDVNRDYYGNAISAFKYGLTQLRRLEGLEANEGINSF